MPRILHHLWAWIWGYCWERCPICGEYVGGHESTDRPGQNVHPQCKAEAETKRENFWQRLTEKGETDGN